MQLLDPHGELGVLGRQDATRLLGVCQAGSLLEEGPAGKEEDEDHSGQRHGHHERPHHAPDGHRRRPSPANAARPRYAAAPARSSSMANSWLYLATRSEPAGAP